ncbi:hypothetical protein ID866_2519 [Astraeus odoratus]|nr:hypothetical protein ID866_2519 [Astraeus odoratus]
MSMLPNHASQSNGPPNNIPNGHHPPKPPSQSKETINVVGVPAVSIQNGKLVVGDANSSSPRSYTPVRILGDGSFGTVLLCDWHDTKELYFVFESMEGNLYHLIKTRKGRLLAGGLVASIFRQIVSGLHHIHSSGYFHRDMKPENVLVTTTGVFEYRSLSPIAPPGATEKDVVAIIKLADFGLARETLSAPPYTEYVSTRWYRAPEVLMYSRDYSNPVDMWAMGTIMAELHQPKDIYTYFDRSIPRKLIECISDLLKYDPDARLTSRQCLEHPYLLDALLQNVPPMPPALYVQTSSATPPRSQTNGVPFLTPSGSPRSIPPSHSHNSLPKSPLPPNFHHNILDASSSHRTAFVPSITTTGSHTPASFKVDNRSDPRTYAQSPLPPYEQEEAHGHGGPHPWPTNHLRNGAHWMDTSPPQSNPPEEDQCMDIQSPHTDPPRIDPQPMRGRVSVQRTSKPSKFGSLSKWSRGMFRHGEKVHQQSLPPVDEVPGSSSMPSLKRTQSTSSDTPLADNSRKDTKAIRKEAERLQREAEMQRRAMAEHAHREQARAVMQKRNQMMQTTAKHELEWKWSHSGSLLSVNSRAIYAADLEKSKAAASGPIRQNPNGSAKVTSPTLSAASGRFLKPPDSTKAASDRWLPRDERLTKIRRRDFDDDHSVSSSDVHSTGRMSAISFATVDSDPGPARVRRPLMGGINRMTSASSLRTGTTSFDDFPASARSSNSISLDHRFNEFNIRASVDTTSSVSGTSSPPPINLFPRHSYISAPMIQYPSSSHTTYECNGKMFGHPPSPAIDPQVAINPMFKVAPLPSSPIDHLSPQSLPPFSQLEAVADGEYPPLSPMSFHSPEDS